MDNEYIRYMKPINLLSCLRGAGERLRLSNEKEKARRPLRWRLFALFRQYRPLINFPLKRASNFAFYVAGVPRPNTKAAAVVNELLAAGHPTKAIVHGTRQGASRWSHVLRFAVRLPWALMFTWSVRKRSRRLNSVDRQTLLHYALARRWLRHRPGLLPVIISDVSPSLHALWCAAAAEGNRALWWQDDFHHHLRLPYPIRAAAVLNEPGLAVSQARGTATVIACRPTESPAFMRSIPVQPVVGMATNVSFVPTFQVRERLRKLAAALETKALLLRLHPNSKLSEADFEGQPVKLAPRDESMADFAARIDVAIVGNSAAQLWLIRNGVPAIHMCGFDAQGYDIYGYVNRGFVVGAKEPEDVALSEVRRFYADAEHHWQQVTNYTTVRNDSERGGLEMLGELLTSHEKPHRQAP